MISFSSPKKIYKYTKLLTPFRPNGQTPPPTQTLPPPQPTTRAFWNQWAIRPSTFTTLPTDSWSC